MDTTFLLKSKQDLILSLDAMTSDYKSLLRKYKELCDREDYNANYIHRLHDGMLKAKNGVSELKYEYGDTIKGKRTIERRTVYLSRYSPDSRDELIENLQAKIDARNKRKWWQIIFK